MATKCVACNKTVYQSDKIAVDGKVWHKLCLIASSSKQPKQPIQLGENSFSRSIPSCLKCGKKPEGNLIGAMYCRECYEAYNSSLPKQEKAPAFGSRSNAPILREKPLLQSRDWSDSDDDDFPRSSGVNNNKNDLSKNVQNDHEWESDDNDDWE
eukprot:TRINITY_DN6502_c0_g1_i1.p1 TRINITY_DN6502_c0_g1~~TRINITY_DN6502_c0_g1_i1.p1  ORF type:complete len:154 (+),score=28.35 TRINITY_DN6502_c0_g1_i1:15-476(+)